MPFRISHRGAGDMKCVFEEGKTAVLYVDHRDAKGGRTSWEAVGVADLNWVALSCWFRSNLLDLSRPR